MLWKAIPVVDNSEIIGTSYNYTRYASTTAVWAGTLSSSGVRYFAEDQYFKLKIEVAKNDSDFGDDFSGVAFGPSSSMMFKYMGE